MPFLKPAINGPLLSFFSQWFNSINSKLEIFNTLVLNNYNIKRCENVEKLREIE